MTNRVDFELFKSTTCQVLKATGDIEFIRNILLSDIITGYYTRNWFAESFYTLAMIDYLSRLNDIPLCTKYNYIRTQTLPEPIFPSSVYVKAKVDKSTTYLDEQIEKAIPEFKRFNIIESEIYNVF